QTVLWRADGMQFHMRPAGVDLDLAVRFSGLRVEQAMEGGDALPAFDGRVDVQLTGGAASAELLPSTLRGRSGTVRNATLTITGSEAGATIRGPVSVDEMGFVDADLEVTLRE